MVKHISNNIGNCDEKLFGSRILVVVPHPDDEVVACAAAIGRAQKNGAKIFAYYITNGCIAREILWPWQRKFYELYVERRRNEAELVAQILNITPAGWSFRPARSLWQCLPDVYNEVQKSIKDNKIDQIWVPAYEGGNADHDGLNAIGNVLSKDISVLEYAEYNYLGSVTREQEFPKPNGTEQTLLLSPQEQEKKCAALKIYASEKNNLGYVGTKRECFRKIAAYDYNQPPHKGKLWYARFQWVPFRHPRVDFTRPYEVSNAINQFYSNINNGK